MANRNPRHGPGVVSVARLQDGRLRHGKVSERLGRHPVACVAHENCDRELVPGAPVRLCGHHLREAYEFAQDFIAARWDGAVREYVADLQDTFKPPRSVTKRPRPGFVYFVRLGDRIKIGYSENVDKRLTVVPHEEVLGVIPGTRDDERAWHKLLADYRTVGEWFRAEPDVLAAVARVVAAVS